jgi:hypothetical protein
MNKKEHLIDSLNTAINALKNDTVYYNWTNQHSCNAGIVSQAVLGVTREELDLRRTTLFSKLEDYNSQRRKENQLADTWKNAVQIGCSLTGKDIPQIVKDLEANGLSREDIVHLEYLNNSAILEESTIPFKDKIETKTIGYETVTVADTSFWGRIFKRTLEIDEPIIVNHVVGIEYEKNYYTKKENLIKYLSAWVRILKSEPILNSIDKENLEIELLHSVAEENYERAAEIRNQLSTLN